MRSSELFRITKGFADGNEDNVKSCWVKSPNLRKLWTFSAAISHWFSVILVILKIKCGLADKQHALNHEFGNCSKPAV